MVTYTTNKGLALPAVAGDSGLWGGELNTSTTTPIDLMIGGSNSISLSSSNYTLSSSDIQYLTQKLSGTLLANVIVYSSCSGFYFIENNTTGDYTVTLQANFGSGNVGSAWVVPQGMRILFVSDGAAGARPATGWPALAYADLTEIATPAAPASGYVRLYAKSGDVMATQTPGGVECLFGAPLTVSRFLSGSGTYAPTAVRIHVRMVAGGGGGAGNSPAAAGANGGTTSLGAWTAIGGAGAPTGGAGGTSGGTGGANGTGILVDRVAGQNGGPTAAGNGPGGSSVFGGGGQAVYINTIGMDAKANTGSGGSGAGANGVSYEGGGQAGEFVEFWVMNPSAMTYTVGAGGAGGAAYFPGGNGAAGKIIIEEFYN